MRRVWRGMRHGSASAQQIDINPAEFVSALEADMDIVKLAALAKTLHLFQSM